VGGWHTLRHTYASMQLVAGTNIVQLSRAPGHHSASFTLDRYVHLLPGDTAPPLDLDVELCDPPQVNQCGVGSEKARWPTVAPHPQLLQASEQLGPHCPPGLGDGPDPGAAGAQHHLGHADVTPALEHKPRC
jgi:hypothetical protein